MVVSVADLVVINFNMVALQQLLTIMSTSRDPVHLQAASTELQTIAADSSNDMKLMKQGAVPVVVDVLRNCNDAIVQEITSNIIHNLSMNERVS